MRKSVNFLLTVDISSDFCVFLYRYWSERAFWCIVLRVSEGINVRIAGADVLLQGSNCRKVYNTKFNLSYASDPAVSSSQALASSVHFVPGASDCLVSFPCTNVSTVRRR